MARTHEDFKRSPQNDFPIIEANMAISPTELAGVHAAIVICTADRERGPVAVSATKHSALIGVLIPLDESRSRIDRFLNASLTLTD